ncbi:IS630 family transposase [Aeoliella mucimassa]|uniref:IS630 family transposase n=1 Tax=Aeoliella mucimassa TaxID=2527972 RepID=UPI0011A0ECD5|nr:IS630 family transposase [Aeoliella mucimassa]
MPKLNDEFCERMEDVLEQYEKPLDPNEPVVCLDEQPYQRVDDARPPEPAAPGKIAKQDYEYRRCGTCSVFVAVEPKAGKRFVQAKRHRKRADFARFVRDLLKRYPDAERVHLVMDNLNTHNEKSLIETFGEEAARPMLERIVWHFTPKHASWLNMAEIEISAIQRQCLGRRLASLDKVQSELSHCSRDRNRKKIKINWTFHRKDAKRVFPELYRK